MKKISSLVKRTKEKHQNGFRNSQSHIPRITPELLASSERIGGPESHVYVIEKGIVAKVGEHIRMSEAYALRYIRENTSIPVPRVLDAHVMDEPGTRPAGCIIMERVDGISLDKKWPYYTQQQKDKVVVQLREYINQLRAVTGTKLCALDGNSCNDQLFRNNPVSSGPFESYETFVQGLSTSLRATRQDARTEQIIKFIHGIPGGRIVLTHNNIRPQNILMQDADIVAIVDWERAGFYPEYWEYVKAMLWPDWQSPWITEGVVDRILHPYSTELGLMLHTRVLLK